MKKRSTAEKARMQQQFVKWENEFELGRRLLAALMSYMRGHALIEPTYRQLRDGLVPQEWLVKWHAIAHTLADLIADEIRAVAEAHRPRRQPRAARKRHQAANRKK